jgi:hypothetical protein
MYTAVSFILKYYSSDGNLSLLCTPVGTIWNVNVATLISNLANMLGVPQIDPMSFVESVPEKHSKHRWSRDDLPSDVYMIQSVKGSLHNESVGII